ncbi:hypothetical protein [Azospirillum sp.]|uniref:hypothetical protein n=1 Tax=Azospirillum sp. TaxID=34012 RepID=UPI002D4CE58C|nr:hypothetical protein [Azospirillum sp.]HYF90095.1 hypothetical protein [Azospirillum sp.]
MADDPLFLAGGTPPQQNEPKRVVRTGLAVVHEGETVYPAEGSEADIVAFEVGDRAVLVYYPVHVEVRLAEFDARQVSDMIKDAFAEFTGHIDGMEVT